MIHSLASNLHLILTYTSINPQRCSHISKMLSQSVNDWPYLSHMVSCFHVERKAKMKSSRHYIVFIIRATVAAGSPDFIQLISPRVKK